MNDTAPVTTNTACVHCCDLLLVAAEHLLTLYGEDCDQGARGTQKHLEWKIDCLDAWSELRTAVGRCRAVEHAEVP